MSKSLEYISSSTAQSTSEDILDSFHILALFHFTSKHHFHWFQQVTWILNNENI